MIERYIAYHVDERRLYEKSEWDINMFIMDFTQIADTLSGSECFRTATGINSGGQ